MIEVVIIESGRKLEVKGGIKYTFQTSEIGDISEINSSWSWTIRFLRTANNIDIFQGLGLVGINSNTPYIKIKASVLYNSVTVIDEANLVITATQEDYIGNITSGIANFFELIKNTKLDQIPSVIDSELNHDKTLATISGSWGGTEPYMYAIADYNGKLNADPDYVDFQSAYLVPSVNVEWLMEAIFDYTGWTYSGLPDIDVDWMTYGNKLQEDGEVGVTVGFLTFDNIFVDFYQAGYFDNTNGADETKLIDLTGTPDPVYADNTNISIEINTQGRYKILLPKANFSNFRGTFEYYYVIKINGIYYTQVTPLYGGLNNYIELGTLNVTDEVTFEIVFKGNRNNDDKTITFDGLLTLVASDVTLTDFQGASLEYNVIEFFKEVMIRNAAIAIPEVKNKHIDFYSVEDRKNFDEIDWTSKYVRKTSESYVYQDYAQRNYLRHTYSEDGLEYNDGFFEVTNENIAEKKTIYQSKSFSSNKNLSIIESPTQNDTTVGFESYEIEIKNNGQIYKPLNDRFFFIKQPSVKIFDFKIDGNLYTFATWANAADFKDVVPDEYAGTVDMLNRVKLIEVDLVLNIFDVKDLDFAKKYYFTQEGSFFLLNKITWDSETEISKGEFIKLQSENQVVIP